MTVFKAVERVQLYCNILGRATASLCGIYMHMLCISRHVCTYVSKHLLYFWTTFTVVYRGMYKLPQTLLCNKIMLCLKETIVTSLITNKLFNSYTLLPSSVSCVQVSNHKRTELSDFDEKNLNPDHQTNDEVFKIRKPTGLFEAYSTRCWTVLQLLTPKNRERKAVLMKH